MTMWMPVAPPGYVALGAVVIGGPSVPTVDEYLCVREDLTALAQVFDSPIWAYDPLPAQQATPAQGGGGGASPSAAGGAAASSSAAVVLQSYQPETWKVAVWPVDSRLGTFLCVRALSKPPAEVARSVVEVEQRESNRNNRF